MRGRPCVFSLIAAPQRGQNRFVHPAINSTMSNDSNCSMSSKLHGVFPNVLETPNKKAAMDFNQSLPKKAPEALIFRHFLFSWIHFAATQTPGH
jgi:hypothetical protein